MATPEQMVHQFSISVVALFIIVAMALAAYRKLAKPRSVRANGLPERRRRPRLVLPDPATLKPRPVAPGTTI
jgi:hypothetical protein